MDELPLYIPILFGLTIVLTVVWSYLAIKSTKYLILVLIWLALQSVLGYIGFYNDSTSIPPRLFLFGVFPTLLVTLITFLTQQGKAFIDRINLKTLTYFHSIRIPVEIVLALLYHHGLVSIYVTIEGTNMDLFSGVTAPLVAYLVFKNSSVNKKLLLGWNVFCLLLLLNVVITAILSIPSPFQQVSLDQPTVAVLTFPFNLLPAVVVPIVLFGHFVAIRHLTIKPGGN